MTTVVATHSWTRYLCRASTAAALYMARTDLGSLCAGKRQRRQRSVTAGRRTLSGGCLMGSRSGDPLQGSHHGANAASGAFSTLGVESDGSVESLGPASSGSCCRAAAGTGAETNAAAGVGCGCGCGCCPLALAAAGAAESTCSEQEQARRRSCQRRVGLPVGRATRAGGRTSSPSAAAANPRSGGASAELDARWLAIRLSPASNRRPALQNRALW